MSASDSDRPEPVAERIMKRILGVARTLVPDPADAEDLVQCACLTYVKQVTMGKAVHDAEAFLVAVVQRAAPSLGRRNRRRGRWLVVGLDGDSDRALARAGNEVLDYESLLACLRGALPAGLRASFHDCLAGKEDAEVAARDGVDEAAVRKRRSRLMAALMGGLLAEILEGGRSQISPTGTYLAVVNPTPNTQHPEK